MATTGPMSERHGSRRDAWRAIEVAVLSSFAIGQPLLSLVGDSNTFLVAHGLSGRGVVAYGLAVLLLPAIVLASLGFWIARLNPSAGLGAHRFLLGGLLALTIGPPLNRELGLDGMMSVVVLITLGTLATVAFTRFESMSALVRYAGVAPVLFLAMFLFSTRALIGSETQTEMELVPETRPPIVWLVFDQLPLALLLDSEGRLAAERYPGFARLAEIATWYRNAATVSAHTDRAIPSTLTGRYAEPGKAPNVQSYPATVFTLLGSSYTISARETVTRLCPSHLCGDGDTPTTTPLQLLSDSAVTTARLLLADGLADSFLPRIDSRWANFGGDAGQPDIGETRVTGDDRWRFEEFLDDIGTMDRATLHYLHQEKPHEPLLMLPDGRIYDFCSCYRTTDEGRWPNDEVMMNQRLQQYVMQTMYVDGQVTRVLDRMEETGILDEAILIVMSDHGASMLPGHANRGESSEVVNQVFPVPLFIKLPAQTSGDVDDRQVTVIDVVPTLFEAMGADHSAIEFDGRSLLTNFDEDPFLVVGKDGVMEINRPDASASALVDMVAKLLPVPNDPFVFGSHGHLVGSRVDNHLVGTSGLTAELAVPKAVTMVDLDADYVPAHVIGELFGANSPTPLAVAFNDVIAGVGSSYDMGLWRISLMGNPAYFTDGENQVRIYEITSAGLLHIELTD